MNKQNCIEHAIFSPREVQQSRERGYRRGYVDGVQAALDWLTCALLSSKHIDLAVLSMLMGISENWQERLQEWAKPENVDRLGTMVKPPKAEGE